MIETVAIVGAGVGGARGAEALRNAGFDGRVLLIGAERWLPYERPPLSKSYLHGEAARQPSIYLHDDAWYIEHGVELMLGTPVEAVDPRAGTLRLADGRTPRVDKVLMATGAHPRRLKLPGASAANVHYLRSKDDADGIARALRPGARLLVVGMGVIGAEIAATARLAGCEVTVVEPAPSPMLRSLGTRFGTWLGRVHTDNGVTCRFGIGVERFVTDAAGDVRAVECADGSLVECDAVVVGIGIDPAVGLARDAGLALGNGIRVDSACRTSNPLIFAAGDVTDQPGFNGSRVRLETFHNAADQAAAAAASMLGAHIDYRRPCRFWSDQYELNLQAVGRLEDRLPVVTRGSVGEASFTAFFLDDGVVAGALAVNRPADASMLGRLVEQRLSIDPGRLADACLPLRDLVRHEKVESDTRRISAAIRTEAPPVSDAATTTSEAARLCRVDEVNPGEPVPVTVEGLPPLAVYEVDGSYFVTDNTCTHGRAELTDGLQEGATIECPFHGGTFDIITGAAKTFPCTSPLRTYPARLEDGWIVTDRNQTDQGDARQHNVPATPASSILQTAS